MTDASDGPPPDPPRSTRMLDRAPGERYRGMGAGAGAPTSGAGSAAGAAEASGAGTPIAGRGSVGRAVLAGGAAAVAGGALWAVLGEIELGAGLLAVAGFIGWAVAVAMIWGAGVVRPIPRSRLVAAMLGAGSIILGLLLATVLAQAEGGVLGPLDYTNERYGPLAYAAVLIAGLVAAVRGR
jgi:hypothetical protein